MTALLAPLVVLLNGLAAGVLLGTQLGGWPLLAALPPDRYVHAHAFFATRYDPAMPICLLGTLVGDLLLGLGGQQAAARLLCLVAALLAAATIAISITKNVPINKWIGTIDPENLPENFAELDPRGRWGPWNRRRSVLAVLALVANCAALSVLL
ncbi:anthrone oxygenase family protein [Kitasatospora kifunensis]|uniref:Putative membrane protein n=1 Tax=Kitasatospora kifunensis TaxID=58351 RepID=A0A7W7R440_KITKI|nr:anthrone oxygenase family protein [Kitasatospora kifunensis]MBB4924875.1 putative membrane protein [Kitasatospora kifunensis]